MARETEKELRDCQRVAHKRRRSIQGKYATYFAQFFLSSLAAAADTSEPKKERRIYMSTAFLLRGQRSQAARKLALQQQNCT